MNFETLSYEKKDFVGTLTINRPKALNALNRQLITELGQFLNEVDEDKDLRCLIITGSGDKAFVAGADIKEMEDLDAAGAKEFSKLGQDVFRRLEVLKVPVIAAVNGFALGGGLELAMACDFILASDDAKLGLPETSLGLIPGFGGTVRLRRYVGMGKAKEMTYTGDHYSSEEAYNFGLVTKILPKADLLAAAEKMASKISKRGPVAVGIAKMAINESGDLALDAAMEMERSQFGAIFKTEDKNIGINAFINKEKPNFKGE